MRNSDAVKVYLNEVSRALIGSKSRKKEILNQLSIDLEDYADSCGSELSLDALERRFGSPRAAASSLLMETQFPVVKQQITQKRSIMAVVLACGIFIAVLVACYMLYDNWRKEDFLRGYEAETQVYAEENIPEHITNLPENTRTY